MFPMTAGRVTQNTAEHINAQIRRQIEENVARCVAMGREAIDLRLAELDQEWDIEWTLVANAATLALARLTLGDTVNRKWFLFPGVFPGVLLRHALQGGGAAGADLSPHGGIRTTAQIAYERYALKLLRGDFDHLNSDQTGTNAYRLMEAMET